MIHRSGQRQQGSKDTGACNTIVSSQEATLSLEGDPLDIFVADPSPIQSTPGQ